MVGLALEEEEKDAVIQTKHDYMIFGMQLNELEYGLKLPSHAIQVVKLNFHTPYNTGIDDSYHVLRDLNDAYLEFGANDEKNLMYEMHVNHA